MRDPKNYFVKYFVVENDCNGDQREKIQIADLSLASMDSTDIKKCLKPMTCRQNNAYICYWKMQYVMEIS